MKNDRHLSRRYADVISGAAFVLLLIGALSMGVVVAVALVYIFTRLFL